MWILLVQLVLLSPVTVGRANNKAPTGQITRQQVAWGTEEDRDPRHTTASRLSPSPHNSRTPPDEQGLHWGKSQETTNLTGTTGRPGPGATMADPSRLYFASQQNSKAHRRTSTAQHKAHWHRHHGWTASAYKEVESAAAGTKTARATWGWLIDDALRLGAWGHGLREASQRHVMSSRVRSRRFMTCHVKPCPGQLWEAMSGNIISGMRNAQTPSSPPTIFLSHTAGRRLRHWLLLRTCLTLRKTLRGLSSVHPQALQGWAQAPANASAACSTECAQLSPASDASGTSAQAQDCEQLSSPTEAGHLLRTRGPSQPCTIGTTASAVTAKAPKAALLYAGTALTQLRRRPHALHLPVRAWARRAAAENRLSRCPSSTEWPSCSLTVAALRRSSHNHNLL
jgi:hypothetical protein